MLVSLQTETEELSFLLHKHPGRVHTQDSSFGHVHVFYPQPRHAVLLMEIDPLKLTRRGGSSSFALQPYVNDRAYVASSFLSVALNQMFRTAMAGRCESHPDLVLQPLDLAIHLPVLPCRGGEALLRRLFEPLGYTLQARALPLDERYPEWGASSLFDVRLSGRLELFRALRHLYILMPVLDNEKHYWVGPDEVNKLLERGRDWLAEHPERDLIVSRYLRFRRDLSQRALSELTPLLEEEPEEGPSGEEDVERRIGLHDLRLDAVAAVLEKDNVRTVADLGCGEGRLLRRLIKNKNLSRILACDVSSLALERAAASLERMNERQREKVQLFQSSLLYADARLAEVDAAVLVEVIEHIEPDRLPRVADNLFGRMRPRIVILTTPNREYNVVWESLPAGRLRHGDHRFEWTRQEFQEWASQVKSDYHVEFQDLGEPHPELGAPSQMAVFRR